MTGPGAIDRGRALQVVESGVPVGNLHHEGRADGVAMTQAREKGDGVLLDFHPCPAPVTALTTLEFGVDEIDIEHEPGGHAIDHDGQGRSVRFTGGMVGEGRHGHHLSVGGKMLLTGKRKLYTTPTIRTHG